MRLTPLGKLLLFLIGLGLVATALHRFVPAPLQFWRPWLGLAPATAPASPTAARPAPSGAPTARPAAPADPWVAVPGGALLAGEALTPTDVPAFRLGRTEVTNGEFERFVAACPVGSACGPRDLPSYWDDPSYLAGHRAFPVVFVSAEDAAAYCRHVGGRLPTIVEWERAARGDDARLFPWGDAPEPGAANLLGADHSPRERAAKQIPTWAVDDPRMQRDRSPFGLLGMAGNVSEWTASRSAEEPDLALVAGGSWDSWDAGEARVSHRVPKLPTDRSSSVGFRCAAAR